MTNPRSTRQKMRIATIAQQVARLEPKRARAWHAIDLTLPDGYPAGSSEHVSGGGIGRPIEAAILAREKALDSHLDDNDVAHQRGLAVVDEQLSIIEQALRKIDTEFAQYAARLVRTDPPARNNVTSCEGCERPITGTPTDRNRSGYCGACWMAWCREGRPDRTQFNRQRRRAAAEGDHSKTLVLDRDTAGIDLWVAGHEATLTGELAIEYRALEREHGTVPIDDLRRLHTAATHHDEGPTDR